MLDTYQASDTQLMFFSHSLSPILINGEIIQTTYEALAATRAMRTDGLFAGRTQPCCRPNPYAHPAPLRSGSLRIGRTWMLSELPGGISPVSAAVREDCHCIYTLAEFH
jgi:hypothetical protein